jgi:hypothetical protein
MAKPPPELLTLLSEVLDQVAVSRVASALKALNHELTPASIKTLPAEARDLIEGALRGGCTYDQIVALLVGHGFEISRSAVGRWGKEARGFGERLRRSREITRAIVADLADEPESRLTAYNVEVIQSRIMDLISGEAEFSPKELKELTEALRNTVAAQKLDTDRQLRLRKEIAAELEIEKKRAAAEATAEAVERGMDTASVSFIRAQILGITLPEPGRG